MLAGSCVKFFNLEADNHEHYTRVYDSNIFVGTFSNMFSHYTTRYGNTLSRWYQHFRV